MFYDDDDDCYFVSALQQVKYKFILLHNIKAKIKAGLVEKHNTY